MRWLLPVAVAALFLSACSSKDREAQQEAARASSAYNMGAYRAAELHINNAIALRDDVPAYWRILGFASASRGNLEQAYTAFRNTIALDPADTDSLRYACVLGSQLGDTSVEELADRLLDISPDDPAGLIVKGRLAEIRGDRQTALKHAEKVLEQVPGDTGAQMLKARIFLETRRADEAKQILAQVLKEHGNEPSLIMSMMDIYRNTGDRANYERMVARLAVLSPGDWEAQVRLADALYSRGNRREAYDLVKALMRKFPADIELSNALLRLMQVEGRDAMPVEAILPDAAAVSTQMRSVYAAYANSLGKPELSLRMFAGKTAGIDNNPYASAAVAEALAMTGRQDAARRILTAAQEKEPGPNRTSLIDAKLFFTARQYERALASVRQLVASDPANIEGQLLQFDILRAKGDEEMALTALRDALEKNPGDVRIAARLVERLEADGKAAAAGDVLDAMVRDDPFNRRAARLRNGYCARHPSRPCPSVVLRKGEKIGG